jgi:hypothetical protein
MASFAFSVRHGWLLLETHSAADGKTLQKWCSGRTGRAMTVNAIPNVPKNIVARMAVNMTRISCERLLLGSRQYSTIRNGHAKKQRHSNDKSQPIYWQSVASPDCGCMHAGHLPGCDQNDDARRLKTIRAGKK